MAIFKVNHQRVASVSLTRTAHPITADLALWVVIRNSCSQLRFSAYKDFIDNVMCLGSMKPDDPAAVRSREVQDFAAYVGTGSPRLDADRDPLVALLPMSGTDRYALLRAATEVFVMANCGVVLDNVDIAKIVDKVSKDPEMASTNIDLQQISQTLWSQYQRKFKLPETNTSTDMLPYYGLIMDKLSDVRIDDHQTRVLTASCSNILRAKLARPCFLELIWSYWHEEGMLVQAVNAILLRFQNVRSSDRDPLANMEIDPLRPLNNLLWGLIQDEQNRLTVNRRAYEYNHQYGLSLVGKAVPNFRPADVRSKFIEAFHNLLYLCSVFYKEDDDTTVVADGFRVLNAIKEVHMILTEGSHNQYGDLPSAARQEMLIQQWILARPEMREFLPTRVMVAYEEPWMDRVDAMKKIQGWTATSVYHFRDLGFFGEQLLLAIRYGAWSQAFASDQGGNWARFWRTQVQGYIHGYRAVTGVDLAADQTMAEDAKLRDLPPSVHLQRRLAQQVNKVLPEYAPRMLGSARSNVTKT
jgi:hypothetical protein